MVFFLEEFFGAGFIFADRIEGILIGIFARFSVVNKDIVVAFFFEIRFFG